MSAAHPIDRTTAEQEVPMSRPHSHAPLAPAGRWRLAAPRLCRGAVAAGVFALALGWLAAPRPAAACGNVTYPSLDRYVADIKKASKALEAGWPTRAAAQVLRTFPSVRRSSAAQLARFYTRFDHPHSLAPLLDRRSPEAGRKERARRGRVKRQLARRARVIMALATLRTDGSPGKRRPWRGSRKARDANLRWAVDVLTASRPAPSSAATPHAKVPAAPKAAKPARSPLERAWRAEALARTHAGQAEALRELQDLDRRKLLGEPMGYAALAALHRARADRVAARGALARCRAFAARKSQCRVYLGKAPVSQRPVTTALRGRP